METRKRIVGIGLIGLMLTSSFLFIGAEIAPNFIPTSAAQAAQGLSANLNITVKSPDGTSKSYFFKHDPFTTNFLAFLEAVLGPNGQSTTTATNTANSQYTLYVKGTVYNTGPTYCGNTPFGNQIQIGSGTGTASPTDYNLITPYQSPVTVSSVVFDTTLGNITFSASILAQSAVTMTEVGALESWCYNGGGSTTNFLILHDTFSPISISSGSTITVQYIIELLNTGFTNNFGQFLTAAFKWYSGQGAYTAIPMTAANGAPITPCYNGVACGTYPVFYYNAINYTFINFGSLTTALSRTAYKVNKIGTSISSYTQSQVSTSEIDYTGSESFVSSATISESGMFVMVTTGYNTVIPVMMWRQIIPTQTVGASQSLGITFKLTFG